MDNKELTRSSKFLSLVLRHKPEKIGIVLDSAGWVSVSKLLKAINANNKHLTLIELKYIVESNDKKRFSFSEDKTKIRANQGHSVEINLELDECKPPSTLYHGTIQKFISSIYRDGLSKMNRHHVHLSDNIETAEKVGARRGKPVILVINTEQMYKDEFKFYISDNGVWLTNRVPPKYILAKYDILRLLNE